MKDSAGKKIIFVHNANSGFMSAMVDGLHKSFRPSTYQCQLCALTYGAVSMKKQWKDFIEGLPYEIEVTYRDKFAKDYPGQDVEFPTILMKDGEKFNELISAKKFQSLDSLDGLIAEVESSIKSYAS